MTQPRIVFDHESEHRSVIWCESCDRFGAIGPHDYIETEILKHYDECPRQTPEEMEQPK